MKIVSVCALLLLSGCAFIPGTTDPLGSPAKNVEGEADFTPDHVVVCRELIGQVDATAIANAQASGFRCIESGEVKGCVSFQNGRIKYESEGCSKRSINTED